jgi:hypothetical protein
MVALGSLNTMVGTVAQVMEGMVFPSSQVVFDVAVWSNGVQGLSTGNGSTSNCHRQYRPPTPQ